MNDTTHSPQPPDAQPPASAPPVGEHSHYPGLDLLPQHKKLLADSSISPEVALARGYRSARTTKDLEALGFAPFQRKVPALVIPIRDVHGDVVTHQIRPDSPRNGKGGKPVKYESPKGARICLDVPSASHAHLGDPEVVLVFTEGARKVDAGLSHGLTCIGVNGVYGWRGRNAKGGSVALPDFESMAFKGPGGRARKVLLAFDSDAAVNPKVRGALSRFRRFLEGKGAAVMIVNLPHGDDGTKVGLDDFFAAGRTAADVLALASDDLPPLAGRAPQPSTGYDAHPRVLVPGTHPAPDGTVEVGTHRFAREVLGHLPPGALYRMDFIVGRIAGPAGGARFVRIDEHLMRQIVDEHVRLAMWIEAKSGERMLVFLACNRDRAALVLAAAGISDAIRSLRVLTHYPVYLPGFALASKGWNDAGGVFYDPAPGIEGVRPDANGATGVIRDLLVDFPFDGAASLQNVIAFMLLIVLRPAIRGAVPFHGFFATMPRTGKGKCINASAGEAIMGQPIAPMQVGSSEEEREKRITSLILGGATVVHFDNLPVGEVLDSPALASLATAYPDFRGRVLGVSKAPALPNNLVVALSGNCVKATDEIVKRMVPVWLRPKDDHPESRSDFVHPLIEEYARLRRPAVLAALLGLVEAWKAAGMPGPRERRRMGGFEEWTLAVGGVMHHAGLDEWLANYAEWVRSGDEWTADAEALVDAWYAKYGEREVTASAILGLVTDLRVFPSVLAKQPAGQAVSLARTVLTPLCGRPVGRWVVVRTSPGSNSKYRLQPTATQGDSWVPWVSPPSIPTHMRAHARANGGVAGETHETHRTPSDTRGDGVVTERLA